MSMHLKNVSRDCDQVKVQKPTNCWIYNLTNTFLIIFVFKLTIIAFQI
jgi:hypothetical protein